MITESTPTSNAEARPYITENPELVAFIDKFTEIDENVAQEMKTNIEALDLLKLSEKDIVSIINILPKDMEDLNKILADTKLEDDEATKILDIIN